MFRTWKWSPKIQNLTLDKDPKRQCELAMKVAPRTFKKKFVVIPEQRCNAKIIKANGEGRNLKTH